MPMRSKRKKPQQARGGETLDRMSTLPDEILTLILSFLSTKESVRTAILSTRWKFVWASVPTLHLSDSDFFLRTDNYFTDDEKIKARFLNFVDRVLMGHSMPLLEKISITGSRYDPSDIELWICAAVEQNVRELDLVLGCYVEPPRELPQCLFSCNTLVVLNLGVDMVLNFTMTSTCFPNLKVLKLSSVIFKDDNSAQNLFSSCPVLEDLVILRTDFDNLRTLNVTSRALKNLLVESRKGQKGLQKLVIDAPALGSICIEDDVTEHYVVRDLSSIIKAKLDVSDSFSDSLELNYAIHLFKLLSGISNVKFLCLSRSTISSLLDGNSYNLPTFHNLTSLEFFADDGVYEWSWKLLLKFLNSSPVLENLVFQEFYFSNEELLHWWQWRDPVPNCLHSHLKTIKIFEFNENEMEKVSYLLANAKVLENMTIELKKVRQQLSRLYRGSMRCNLEIL